LPIETLKPYRRNPRTHSKKQIRQIANSIERFGFTNPVLVGDDNEIIAGHGRVEAARLLGRTTVPTLKLSHLGRAERRAYVIADNKLALNAGWDREVLALELQGLIDLEFDLDLTGFSLAELDLVLDEHQESSTEGAQSSDDELPPLTETAVSSLGDVWQIGRHRLVCGDAQQAKTLALLMNEDRADLIFTDPPYNVRIDGHVCGLGRVRHREFAMAAGEMSRAEFTRFLQADAGQCRSAGARRRHRFRLHGLAAHG
jgi:ParB-like chromosome segregation protein Spo0J